ncbi:SPOR domain-containing protein [Rappaport israeli]|uniref:SPOR domain-containing protein n=1 Tax=Rappaport israeli TaxID=1839807 RepID=UPI00130166CA|nr:SPOR domain-containing protein [Rappaport israeli]
MVTRIMGLCLLFVVFIFLYIGIKYLTTGATHSQQQGMVGQSKSKPTQQSQSSATVVENANASEEFNHGGQIRLTSLEDNATSSAVSPQSAPQTLPAQSAVQKMPEQAPKTNKAKYSFYEELKKRSNEVEQKVEQKAKVKTSSDALFIVQVGAFRDKNMADRLRARLILRDYPVSLAQNKSIYVVQVGPYASHKEAEAMESQLKREGMETLVKSIK